MKAIIRSLPSLFIFGVKDFLFDAALRSFLKDFKPEGLALFNSPHDSVANIWKDPDASLEQVYEFNREVESLHLERTPFLSVDQEGGRVQRLRGHFLRLPTAENLAQAFAEKKISAEEIKQFYGLAAAQMRLAKVKLNFAPVCDLKYSGTHSVIGDRSFGETAAIVSQLAGFIVDALESNGVYSTLKHFPGHGSSKFDSHERIALLSKNEKDLEKSDFLVFQNLASQATAIMPGHLAFEAEPEKIISLDKELLKKWQNKLLDYQKKCWITDDLQTMKAVNDKRPCRLALRCDYDFLLCCGTLDQSTEALEDALRFLETEIKSFSEEQAFEKRVLRSQAFADRFRSHEKMISFSAWKKQIVELQQKGDEIGQKIAETSS